MSSKTSVPLSTYVVGLLLSAVSIISVVFLVIGNPFTKTSEVCLEKECIFLANRILSNIDENVNPCDDFYQFACGGYAELNPIPEHESEISAMTKINDLVQFQMRKILEEPSKENEAQHFRKLKKFFKSCMDTETIEKLGLTPMKEIMASVGGWPVVEDKEPENDWQTVLYTLRDHNLEGMSLLNMYIDGEYDNSTRRIIKIGAPTYTLYQEIMAKGKTDKTVQAYLKYMLSVTQMYGAKMEIAKRDMEDVLDFEITLAKASKSAEEKNRNTSALNNIYSISKLEEEFPKFPWFSYMNAFAPKNFTVTRDRKLIIMEPNFVNILIDSLETTPNRTIINYVIWKEALATISHLSNDIHDLQQQFIFDVLGAKNRKERFRECISTVTLLLPLISSLYVRKLFNEKSRDVATDMVVQLKEGFKTVMSNANWTDEDKRLGTEKVDAMNQVIGFQNELLEDAKIESVYKTLEIVEGDYFKSVFLIHKFNYELFFDRLDLPINKTDWIDAANAAIVTAYNQRNTNVFVVTAAFLQGSFFHADRPKYFNFATIGSVIAHEMSHGFDEVGHRFDKNGELNNWWSEQANSDFAEKKKCIIDQFDNYTIFDGQHLKGGATVSENLADFGGQKIAYLSYQNWASSNPPEPTLPGVKYTIDQLYWIAGASIWCNTERDKHLKIKIATDSHSPNPFRVNGPFSNLEDFSKAFNCPEGSKMNPTQKCTPW